VDRAAPPASGFVLVHVNADAPSPSRQDLFPLSRRPKIIAAAADGAYLVLAGEKGARDEVLRAQALPSPIEPGLMVMARPYLEPIPRPEEDVLHLAVTSDGLVAITGSPSHWSLRMYETGRWTLLLPANEERGTALGMTRAGDEVAVLTRDAPQTARSQPLFFLRRFSKHGGERPPILLGAQTQWIGSELSLMSWEKGVVLISASGNELAGEVSFELIRESGAIHLLTVERGARPWCAAPSAEGAIMINTLPTGDWTSRRISLGARVQWPAQLVRDAEIDPLRGVRLPAILTMLLMVMVLALSIARGAGLPLLESRPIATLPRRLLAGAVDLAPVLTTAASGQATLRGPFYLLPTDETMFVAIALTIGMTMIVEIVSGRSIGHHLLGLAVHAEEGGSLPAGRRCLRLLVLAALLLIPPSFILLAVTSRHQGLHDLLARAVVIRRGRHEQQGQPPCEERTSG